MTQKIKDFPELGYRVFAIEIKPYSVNYEIRDTGHINISQRIKGQVKWDGCSNWWFCDDDGLAFHGCTRDHLLNIGKILAECWNWTAELCEGWDEEI